MLMCALGVGKKIDTAIYRDTLLADKISICSTPNIDTLLLKGQFGILDIGPDSEVSIGILYHWRQFSTHFIQSF